MEYCVAIKKKVVKKKIFNKKTNIQTKNAVNSILKNGQWFLHKNILVYKHA